MDPTHGAGERDTDELRLVSALGENDGQAKTVEGVQEQAVESVLDVRLRDANGPEARVSMPNRKEETVESPAELHCFGWSLRIGGSVDRRPTPIPGVVAKETGFPFTLLFDGSW